MKAFVFKIFQNLCFVSILTVLTSPSVQAEISTQALIESPLVQGLGGTFIGIANRPITLFYNPAGLNELDTYGLELPNLTLTSSTDLFNSATALSAMTDSNNAYSALSSFYGKNIYGRAQILGTVSAPHFAITAFQDIQTGFTLSNPIFPSLSVLSQKTYGIQAGAGFQIARFHDRRGHISMGAAIKFLHRSGIPQTLDAQNLTSLNPSLFSSTLSTSAAAVGVDWGILSVYHLTKRLTFQTGLSWLNVGNTIFGSGITPVPQQLGIGSALQFKNGLFTGLVAADFASINENIDGSKKIHFGAELQFPLFTFDVGYQDLNMNYGVGIDLWLLRISAASYVWEQGVSAGQNPERRFVLSAATKFEF